jgi:hypothetical protein
LPGIRVFASYLSDSIPIHSTILKAVIDESLDILGQSAKMLIIEDLKEQDLDLEDRNRSYSLDMIRQMILQTFDEETAELLLIRMKQILKKHKLH